MSFGYDREQRVALGDTAILQATIYSTDDETPIPQADITDVTFTVVKPSDTPEAPTISGAAGTIVGDGNAIYQVDPGYNDEAGQYKAYARFVFNEGDLTAITKSVICNYEIYDPFVRSAPTVAQDAIDQCWMKIEDCFDSEMGGPWLRDMTLNVFDKSKVKGLIPEALLEINQQMPFTDFTEESFPYTQGDAGALMAEALLISTIRHLMRAYTEQPDVTSSTVGFLDRKRYQDAWSKIYQLELERFKIWLSRWKLRSYDLSSAALLLGTKAGRMLPAPMRSRNVGRGF